MEPMQQPAIRPHPAAHRSGARWSRYLALVAAVMGLVLSATAGVSAQEREPASRDIAGTCADLGLSVVEPSSVAWDANFDPVLDPKYLWAYGDPALLWDNATDEYWFHWYDAVPGPDAFVVYQFAPGTNVQGLQFTHDWSSGDLEVQGLNGSGQPVSATSAVELNSPFQSRVAPLAPMSVSAMKLTTSTQQVKLLEVDFCGGTAPSSLDLTASAFVCESISATWTPQSGAEHQVTVINSNGGVVDSQSASNGTYGPISVPAGEYTIIVTASSAAGTSTEQVTVMIEDCANPGCSAGHDSADAYCPSINVIDSFGDAPLPPGADTGMQWNNVRSYYSSFGDRPGMCSIGVHNSYWTAVRSSDGTLTYYPSWHPPVHDPGGPEECRFTHEHGLDPRSSDLYDEAHPTNVGVPFGLVHPGTGGVSGRVEDHVGHKVVVENDLQLTLNNPYSEGTALQLFEPNGQPITCDWYSKLHQGTHSIDALGFNLHEYYLNYSCDDGTEVRIKEMSDFGFETPGTPVVAQPGFPLAGGNGSVASDCGWFATNLPAPASDPDPSGDSDFGDAKRGFTCLMNDAKIEELWKASAYLSAPDGAATIKYDPYYVVMNSNRFALYRWWDYLEQDGDHVGENANISMVDFCVNGTELRNELMRPDAPSNFVKSGANYGGKFRVQTYCDSIDATVRDQWAQDISNAGGDTSGLMTERKLSVNNPFLGTRRGVHTKGPVMYGSKANVDSLALFCTDHLGNSAVWPTNPATGALVTPDNPWSTGDPMPACANGVAQILSSFNNGHDPVEGSTAGATASNGQLIANGPAGEIIIDIDTLYPNHGIQAPN